MFRSLRISHVEFRFPGSEKLGPGRNGRMERKISGISGKKRTTSRGWPTFSKRFSGNFLFHSILTGIFGNFGRMERDLGLPEIDSRESASATTSLCTSLLKASGVDINKQNVDIAHRVPTRQATAGPRPVIWKFTQRIVKEEGSYRSNEGSLQGIGNIDWSYQPNVL